jgi:hypothetical protein
MTLPVAKGRYNPCYMREYEARVDWYWQGKTEVLGEKPVPVPFCPPSTKPVTPRRDAGDWAKRLSHESALIRVKNLSQNTYLFRWLKLKISLHI